MNWAQEMIDRKAIILDVETTGLHNAQIVQIGMVDLAGNVLMDTFVRPEGHIPADATAVHGITDAMVAAAPGFKDLYVSFSVLLAGKVVVAYNVEYEKKVIQGECQRLNLPLPRVAEWSCAMKSYAHFWGERNRRGYKWQSLSKACQQQRIQVRDAHSAVGDCRLTLALIQKMAG